MENGCEKLKPVIDIFKKSKPSIIENYSPYFYAYFKQYFDDPSKLTRKFNEVKTLLSRVNLKEGIFVDLGCGFGLESIIIALITNNIKIIGIDHNEEKVKCGRKFAKQSGIHDIEFMLQKGEALPVDLQADIILCRDVISHVNDINTFFDSIIHILREGGIFYIIDDRNFINPLVVWRTKQIQKRAESSRVETEKLREIDSKKIF